MRALLVIAPPVARRRVAISELKDRSRRAQGLLPGLLQQISFVFEIVGDAQPSFSYAVPSAFGKFPIPGRQLAELIGI